MVDLGSRLLHQFLRLLDPDAKPEKVLQSLESPCLTSRSYTKGVDEPVIIFLAHIKFILKWVSDGYVDEIWGDLLRKTVLYSQHFSVTDINRVGATSFEAKIILASPTRACHWLDDILSSHTNCPDPYVRLEMFRLIRIFQTYYDHRIGMPQKPSTAVDWKRLSNTFIHTICEIEPQQLYPRGEIDDLVFSVTDMDYIIRVLTLEGNFIDIMSTDIFKHFNEKNEVNVESIGTRFIVNGMKLIRIFAIITESAPNSKQNITEILNCFSVFKDLMMCGGVFEESEDQLQGIPIGKQFQYFVTRPPFRQYVDETVRALSAAVMNSKYSDMEISLPYLRDLFTEALNISTKASDLPKLFLSRQIYGPSQIHQHSLLLRNLDPLVKKRDNKAVDLENINWFEDFIETYGYDEYLDCEPGSNDTTSNSNDYSTENTEESTSSNDSSSGNEDSSSRNDFSDDDEGFSPNNESSDDNEESSSGN